jgi:hypothetical protein
MRRLEIRNSTSLIVAALSAVAVLLAFVFVGSASAAQPWWELTAGSRPAYLAPESEGEIVLTAENLGDAPVEGQASPATIADTLPSGLKAVGISATTRELHDLNTFGPGTAVALPCSLASLTCTLNKTLEPYDQIEVRIKVTAAASVSSAEENHVSISGGGAPPATIARPLGVGESTPFGVEDFRARFEEEGGGSDTQAGSHPFQFTTTVAIDQGADPEPLSEVPNAGPVALAKDVYTKLPAGLAGNPTPFPTCSLVRFETSPNSIEDECPPQTAIGIASVTVDEPYTFKELTFTQPLFNLEPYYGEPARFGFFVAPSGTPVILDTSLRDGPGEDYGIDVNSTNIVQIAGLISARVTVWGTPGDPRHDNSRGWGCLREVRGASSHPACTPSEEKKPTPFLVLPSSCTTNPQAGVEVDSWAAPGKLDSASPSEPLEPLAGCNHVPFTPTAEAQPTTQRASAPSGLDFNLDFENEGLFNEEGLTQSELNKTVVVLPEGLTINPSAGVGLGGCTPEDYARETLDSVPGAGCPDDSKLGTVEIETPLLTQKIKGNIFIAQPYDNPSDSLVALYVVAKNPETGVLIKLAGKVEPNLVTGQLTTIFENNPQLPFTHFNFHFREGQQAPLISPPLCGTYTTQALLSSWSEPLSTLTDSSSFQITQGYDGGACPTGGAPPFKPGIVAGQINNNAASFSPFYLHLSRNDGEQEISGFSTNLPSGLTGDLTGIPFCPEADIEAARHETGAQEEASPSCPAASEIGHTLVGTGVGAVLAYVPGKIYLAGPFHGAPLSIVSITSAVVGPFDLGTVVLRFGLDIDPTTARVNVTPTSSEPIPTIIDGIVTHVRDIRVYISRPNFILNPTSCDPLSIASTLNSPSGASTTVTSPFQSASCQTLKFAPKFTAATSGKTSRQAGASLSVKLTYPTNALGADTNIAKVKVDLPRQLPSRLSTLQKACTDAQFEANPAGCPAESKVGQAKAITPLIPVPLEGPAYFVSHGGAKFPELIIVLQGYGLTIDLHGETFINKEGITSSTFEAVPDQPIGSFELTLPEGKYSALAANGNLCKSTLTMPTSFVAQNGAEIHESTPIGVTGCKPSVNIVRHSVKGATVTVAASVPAAGKLVASGRGLSDETKRTGKASTLSFSLKLSGREQALLKSHPGRKLAVAVKLTFTPKHGSKLAAGVTVNVG